MSQIIAHVNVFEIVCPHCGQEYTDLWEPEGTIICTDCGKKFNYTSHEETLYSTNKCE